MNQNATAPRRLRILPRGWKGWTALAAAILGSTDPGSFRPADLEQYRPQRDELWTLAERNLLRGSRMGLPSGQDVARKMGITPISDDDLRVGKANEDDAPTNPRLVDISANFRDNAPLWYYILAEAQQQFKNNGTPIRLGPVGGRIVGEVFVGLMLGDKHSFLNQDPNWKPFLDFQNGGKFGIPDLIRQAMKV